MRRSVLALTDVLDLLSHELAGLRRGRFAFVRIASRPLDCFTFWHADPPVVVGCQVM